MASRNILLVSDNGNMRFRKINDLKIVVLLVMFYAVLFSSCIFQNSIKVTFHNESIISLDSASVMIQNFKMTTLALKSGQAFETIIKTDTIRGNKHDVMIQVNGYDKAKSAFSGGFHYNDLTASLPDEIFITIKQDLNIQIRCKY